MTINMIVIPKRYVDLCEGWSGNLDCMLRAIPSTGILTIGTTLPEGCDTNEQHYLVLWRNLAADVYCTRCEAEPDGIYPDGHPDLDALIEFEKWVKVQAGILAKEYGLTDWHQF